MPRALLVLMAAAVVGCGDDGLARAELADRADAICLEYDREARALGALDLADPDAAAEYFRSAAGLAERQQAELEALAPADDVRADFEAFVRASDRAREALADAARDVPSREELLAEIEPLAADIEAAASGLGAQRCGDSG